MRRAAPGAPAPGVVVEPRGNHVQPQPDAGQRAAVPVVQVAAQPAPILLPCRQQASAGGAERIGQGGRRHGAAPAGPAGLQSRRRSRGVSEGRSRPSTSSRSTSCRWCAGLIVQIHGTGIAGEAVVGNARMFGRSPFRPAWSRFRTWLAVG